MKTKKWMSLVLALVMAFSLAIPAFATATPTLDNTDVTDMAKINTATTTVNGTYQAPILALTVPKKINLLLNPYGVSVTTNKDTAIEQTGVQRQIVSADNLIISRSNVPINIKATVTATIASAEGGAWTLAQTAPAADSVKKEAYVYMVFGDVDTDNISTANAVTDFMLIAPDTTNNKSPYEGLAYTDIDYPQTPDLAAVSAATDTRDGIVLKAGEGKETTMNQSLAECDVDTDASGNYVYNEVSAVAFKLDGAMVPNPKDSSWGKDDKLTVSVAWKFVPGKQAASSTVTPDYTGALTYSLGSSDFATNTEVDLAGLVSDEGGSPAWAKTAESKDIGAAIAADGKLTGTATKIAALVTAGKDDGQGGTTPLVAGDTIVSDITFTYTDNASTPATQTKTVRVTVTIAA